MKNVVLFRNNLRVNDNPALKAASIAGEILPLYIYDELGIEKSLGSASKYWLHNALISLNNNLNDCLIFKKGSTLKILKMLVEELSIDCVYIDRTYTPDEIELDIKINSMLFDIGVELKSYNCSLLWEPKNIFKSDESPYKVFTPYYKNGCLKGLTPPAPVGPTKNIQLLKHNFNTRIDDLDLLKGHSWYLKLDNHWEINEDAAITKFSNFINTKINKYKDDRDFPSKDSNSKISPYLRFGMIDVRRMWHDLNSIPKNNGIIHYMSELGWREFSYYLLYHFPTIQHENFQKKFDRFEWINDKNQIESWKYGYTGYPIIDAAMKELWKTGFMHNRMRMVVASFLVKNLLVDWRIGEKWFWECLVDADYASNIAGWQWAAGTGADAAPYFRIFNPILQGEKFDSNGIYTKKYIPELENIPIKYIQKPWEYNLGLEYITPIIDYKFSRQRALLTYQNI